MMLEQWSHHVKIINNYRFLNLDIIWYKST